MSIKRELGDRIVIGDGRDYVAPSAKVIPSTYKDASDDETCLYLF